MLNRLFILNVKVIAPSWCGLEMNIRVEMLDLDRMDVFKFTDAERPISFSYTNIILNEKPIYFDKMKNDSQSIRQYKQTNLIVKKRKE